MSQYANANKVESGAARYLAAAIEAMLLITALAVPLYFNVLSQHIFENHKNALFRAGTFVLLGLLGAYFVERGRLRRLRFFPRKSIARPLYVFIIAQVLSCAFSIGFNLSFWGEIFRQVGLVTLLCSILAFIVIILFFKKSIQIERLVTIFILTSIPVSLYALAQHFGPDPMPWKGNVGYRCVSTLGNAVFLGAFEVMIFFPTLSRIFSSLASEGNDSLRYWKSSLYLYTSVLQAASIWYSKSRGPMLALILGSAFFLVFVYRSAGRGKIKAIAKGLIKTLAASALGLGLGMSIAYLLKYNSDPTAIFAARILWWPGAVIAGGLILAFFPGQDKKSKLALVVLGVFLGACVFTAAQGIHFVKMPKPVVKKAVVKDDDTDSEVWKSLKRTGSVATRVYIWEGFLDIFFSFDPLHRISPENFTEVETNKFTYLRPLFGFGQETVGTAFRQRYPLKLLKKLPPSETADRAHNDILQKLASTGVIGLFAYLWLAWTILAHGFSALGYSMVKKGRKIFRFFFFGGAAAGGVFGILAGIYGVQFGKFLVWLFGLFGGKVAARHLALLESDAAFIGVGVQVGIILGVLGYCIFGKLRSRKINPENAAVWTAAGLFCGIMANIVETTVAFQFSSTMMCFWMFAGLLVATALRRLSYCKPASSMEIAAAPAPAKIKKNSKKKKQAREAAPEIISPPAPRNALALAILCGVIVSMIAFDFLGYQWPVVHSGPAGHVLKMPNMDAVPGMGLLRTGKTDPADYFMQKRMVMLGLMFLPWLIFCVYAFLKGPENPDKIKWGHWPMLIGAASLAAPVSALIIISLHAGSLLGSEIYMNGPPAEVIPKMVEQTMDAASRVWLQYLWLGVCCAGLAFFLMEPSHRKPSEAPGPRIKAGTVAVSLISLCLIVPAVWYVSYRPVMADILAARSGQWKQGNAAPKIGNQMNPKQFMQTISMAHAMEAAKAAPFITAHNTDLAASASILAQSAPDGESFLGGKAPIGADFNGLKTSDLVKFTKDDSRLLAVAALSNCFSVNPSDPQNAMNLARLYSQWAGMPGRRQNVEKRDLAKHWYETARGMMPHNAHVESEIANFWFVSMRKPQKALDYLERSLDLDDRHLKTYLLMADVRMAMLKKTCGRALASAMSLHQGPEIQPTPECQEGLDEIARLMEEALSVRPKNSKSLVKLAGVFINARKPEKAVEALERGFVVKPRNRSFMKQLVFICKKEKNTDLGLNLFEKITARHPKNAALQITYAEFLTQMGLKHGVPEKLENAMVLSPKSPRIHRDAANLYGRLGMFQKGADSIEKALRLQSRKAENWLTAASLYERLAKYPEAASALEKAARLTQKNDKKSSMFNKAAQLWIKAKNPKRANDAKRFARAYKK